MKKLFFTLALVFIANFGFANVNPKNNLNEKNDNKKEIVKIIEEVFGCASDCVRDSRNMVLQAAEDNGDNANEHQIYMEVYMMLYQSCYNHNC